MDTDAEESAQQQCVPDSSSARGMHQGRLDSCFAVAYGWPLPSPSSRPGPASGPHKHCYSHEFDD
jgi:hypothetical protein